jgi:hypothetical protein
LLELRSIERRSAVPSGDAYPSQGFDSLHLSLQMAPPNVPVMLFQGTSNSSGTAFGDGLLCASGTIVRFGLKTTDGLGTAVWPSGTEARISASGMLSFYAERWYQAYYRNSASYCTSATFNVSNGVYVLWMIY